MQPDLTNVSLAKLQNNQTFIYVLLMSTFALQMTTELTAQTHGQIQYRVLVSSGRVKISLEAQTLLVQHSPGQHDTDHTNLQTDKGYLYTSGWLLALLSGFLHTPKFVVLVQPHMTATTPCQASAAAPLPAIYKSVNT